MGEIYMTFAFDFSNPHSSECWHVSDSKGRTTFYYTVNRTKEQECHDIAVCFPDCYKTIPCKSSVISCHLRFFELPIFGTNVLFPGRFEKFGFHCIYEVNTGQSRVFKPSIFRTSRFFAPWHVSFGFVLVKHCNFTPDFSQPRFFETPDISNYFLLPMEEIYKKFTSDFSNPQESTTQ